MIFFSAELLIKPHTCNTHRKHTYHKIHTTRHTTHKCNTHTKRHTTHNTAYTQHTQCNTHHSTYNTYHTTQHTQYTTHTTQHKTHTTQHILEAVSFFCIVFLCVKSLILLNDIIFYRFVFSNMLYHLQDFILSLINSKLLTFKIDLSL